MKNRTQTRALAVIAVTLATVLSACGSTGSSTSSASSTESQSATATNAASNDPNLLFAQCMRDKGFDVPDTGLTPDQLNDHSTAFDSALNECMMKVSGLTGEDNIANDPQAGEGISVKDIPEDVLNQCFQKSGAAK